MGAYQGKVVWITGAGSGIGKALALHAAREGGAVALSGRRRDKLDEVAAELEAIGAKAMVIPCDVVDEAACQDVVTQILRAWGRLDVSIANAGYSASGTLESLSAAEWRRQLDVNVVGVANTAKASLTALKATKGRLVLVSSVMGMLALSGQGPYSASKFAVRAIGLTLAQELHGTGVSCTTIHPGFVESEIGQVGTDGVFDPSRKDKRPKRFMWDAERAAKVMWSAIDKRKREFVFTGHGKVAAFLGRHMPGLVHFVMTRQGAKKKVLSTTKVQS